MPTYEPHILEEFAHKLYKEAEDMVSQSAVVGVIAGLFVGALIGAGIGAAQAMVSHTDVGFGVFAGGAIGGFVFAVLGGVVGYAAGKDKAFELKLKAQQALCQLQIEKNTRPQTPTHGQQSAASH